MYQKLKNIISSYPFIIYFFSLIIFITDILVPLGYAIWLPYILIVLLSTKLQRIKNTTFTTLLSSIFIIIGFFLSPKLNNPNISAINRLLAIAIIWIILFIEIKQKSKVENILESISEAFVSLDKNWIYIYVNKKAAELFGRKQEDLIGKHIWTEFPEGIGQPFYNNYYKAVKEQTFILMEEYYPPYDKWFENRIYPSKNGLSIFFQDITTRKNAEEKSKKRQRDLGILNSIILKTVESVDLNPRLQYIMDEVLKVVGLEGGTICLINRDDTFSLKVSRETSQESIDDLTQNKVKIGECLCGNCAKDCKPLILNTREEVLECAALEVFRGEDIRFHAAYPFVIDNKCIGVFCVFTRTDKKPTIEDLKLLETIVSQTAILIHNAILYNKFVESEEHYRQLIEHAPVGITVYQDGKIVFTNKAGLNMLGADSYEHLIGKNISELIHPDKLAESKLRIEKMANGEEGLYPVENIYLRLDGTPIIVEVIEISILFSGKPAVQVIATDITDRKKTETELTIYQENLEELVKQRTAELELEKIRAESADKLKSAFLATMSHELRTPLNSIIGFSGILAQEYPGKLNNEQKKQLTMVQNSSRHLLSLINDVLDLSKIEAGQMKVSFESFNLPNIIRKAASSSKPFADNKNLLIEVSIAESVSEIISDPLRVEQILLNVINNAIKFTEQGFVRIECDKIDKEIIIKIRDTGIGIDKDKLDLLFKPFSQIDSGLTRKQEGTGLGLSICKKLLSLLNGSIQVDSEVGIGSIFIISLPLGQNLN